MFQRSAATPAPSAPMARTDKDETLAVFHRLVAANAGSRARLAPVAADTVAANRAAMASLAAY